MAGSVAEGIGMLAGRYELGALIGTGGMSEVFLGTDTRLGRQVAIKLLRSDLAEDPSFRTRFRQEAQAAAKMTHPTIVRIFDAGEQAVPDNQGTERLVPFIVMEHVEGRLLREVIEAGAVTPQEASRIVDQVLTALEYSHRAGVIHRDIKPGNIMLTRGGQVKVMDFGIARAISDSAANLAQTAEVVGTARYFSPEQARGERVDPRSDLYSTGIVLYELLTGRTPFVGENPVAVAYQHVNAEPAAPSTHNPAVTPGLDAVVLKSLAKSPAERYANAAEFRADLQAAASGQIVAKKSSVDAFSSTLFGSDQAAQAAVRRQLTTEVDDRALGTQSGPPVLWIWVGLVAMLAIIAGVVYWIFTLQAPDVTGNLTAQVPEVSGMRFEDGAQVLEDAQLTVDRVNASSATVPEGVIISTQPGVGITVERGQLVEVVVSSGPQAITIPDVSRMNEANAVAALEKAGFVVGAFTTANSPDVPKGTVIRSDPAGGANEAPAQAGTVVNLEFSTGNVTIPDTVGKALSEARQSLVLLKLNVQIEYDTSCTGLKVKSQSKKGTQPQGSTVDLVACSP